MTYTEPRPYSAEWRESEPQPLELPFGTVSIQTLGWGIRVESGPANESLIINNGKVRLGWADFHLKEGKWVLASGFHLKKEGNYGLDNATPKQHEKIAAALFPLVEAWAQENADEIEKRKWAYISDRARTCEESIRELEEALDEYRTRLREIEAGDMDTSPYLNGGKRIRT